MTAEEIEEKANEIRDGPLLVFCVTPAGKRRVMTVRECKESGSQFVHIVADELDALLGRELGGDDGPIECQKRTKSAESGKEV